MTETEKRWFERFREWRMEHEARLERLEREVEQLQTRLALAEKRARPKSQFTEDELGAAREVLNKINEHAGSALRFTNANGETTQHVADIVARLRKGASSWDMRLVAWHKCAEFTAADGIGRAYCRPSTLFGPKFDAYLDDAVAAYAETKGVPVEAAREQCTRSLGEIVRKLEVVK